MVSWREQNLSGLRQTCEDPPWHQPEAQAECPFPAVSDGHTYSRSSHRTRYTCSPAEDWPPPLDLSSDGDVDAMVLRELYPDSPPG